MAAPPRFRLSPDVVFREVGREAVLLDLESGTYFGLNETGALVWRSIQEGRDPAELADRVVREFEVTREIAERDVARLLQDLEARGLVVRAGGDDAP